MNEKLEKLMTEEGMTEANVLETMATRPWRERKNEVQERKVE